MSDVTPLLRICHRPSVACHLQDNNSRGDLLPSVQLNVTPVEMYAEIERQLRSSASHELPVQAFFQAGITRVADDNMIE